MSTLKVQAAAKVNLVLRVGKRRSDGYHEIESLMVPVSLYDDIEIRAQPARSVCVEVSVTGSEDVPVGPDNLAGKAAEAVLGALGLGAQVDISLSKRIPVGAGLGGGSADAAAVVRALPGLLGHELSPGSSHDLALSLGADVPFCLAARPCLARGIGELLEPVDGLDFPHLVVAVPEARVSTRWAYANALKGLTSLDRVPSLTRSSLAGRPLRELVANDFSPGVEAGFADVGRLSGMLTAAGAGATVMSGSGSAMVGLFTSEALARSAAATFSRPDRAWAVEVLDRPV
ncbi:MAG: 4-(cytidine 5'-diphospho)-2-C-methyl-D-erythritol kinase [Deltaproteobacteria bacterium]